MIGIVRVTRVPTVVLASVAVVSWAGCASPGASRVDYGVRLVRDCERRSVFDAAEAALVGAGYRIDRRDFAEGVLSTHPIPGVGTGPAAPRGVRVSSPNHLRRVAEVRIEEAGDVIKVHCRIVVQEQTTRVHRLLAEHYRAADLPTDTPIDREAATTSPQNTVWQTVRRDKAAERAILAHITEQTGGGFPSGAVEGTR